MARSSESDSDFGFSRPHLYGMLGLILGLGIFLLIPAPSEPQLPSRHASTPRPVKAAVPHPEDVDASAELALIAKLSDRGLRPAVAERRPAPRKIVEPRLVAAVAEKPPVETVAIARAKSVGGNSESLTEQDLESSLANSVLTVGLDIKQAGSLLTRMQSSRQVANEPDGPRNIVLSYLDDATKNSLPFLGESDCTLSESKAQDLRKYSRLLHSKIADIDRTSRSPMNGGSASGLLQRDAALAFHLSEDRQCQTSEAVPALVQILQAEEPPAREQLVEILAKHESRDASLALVSRAVFDLSPSVRQYANKALAYRPADDVRKELLAALRYPWSQAAWNAAETLVAVKDAKAIPDLIELLDAPDPVDPFADASGKLVVRELVRVNHFQNCLLCHAQAESRRATLTTVSGAVPTPGRPISQAYYGGSANVFVRADVTYLRQDFSVMHKVDNAKPWPDRQRFDYFVRTREATSEELAFAKTTPAEHRTQYSQRDAVLYALRKLTGKDAGTQSHDWRELLD